MAELANIYLVCDKVCYHIPREFDLTEDLDSVAIATSSFM